MLTVACDNVVDAREKGDWDRILEKASQMMATVMAMMALSVEKEKRPLGAGTPNGPLVNQQSKYSTKKQFSPSV